MLVEITKYSRPNGRQTVEEYDVPVTETKYKQLKKQDCRLAYEILTTGEVAHYIEYVHSDCVVDYRMKISPPGDKEAADLAIVSLINEFEPEAFTKWLAQKVDEGVVPIGPTGTFPQGKCSPQDEGGLLMRLGVDIDSGLIIWDFGKSIRSFGMPVEDARRMAVLLLAFADGMSSLKSFADFVPDAQEGDESGSDTTG